MVEINHNAAFMLILTNIFFRPRTTLSWCPVFTATLMPTLPYLAQRLHVTIKDREKSIFGTAMYA